MIFRAKDIDVAFELVFLAIGAPGLDDIIVDAGRNNLAVITAVPPASRVLIMVKLFAPGFSSRTEDSSHSILHSFLDRLTTSAFAPLRMK